MAGVLVPFAGHLRRLSLSDDPGLLQTDRESRWQWRCRPRGPVQVSRSAGRQLSDDAPSPPSMPCSLRVASSVRLKRKRRVPPSPLVWKIQQRRRQQFRPQEGHPHDVIVRVMSSSRPPAHDDMTCGPLAAGHCSVFWPGEDEDGSLFGRRSVIAPQGRSAAIFRNDLIEISNGGGVHRGN